MGHSGQKVLVALSGGVDSAVAAALLLDRGYDCEAVFMITCNEAADETGAKKIAGKLKIPLHILDVRKEFQAVINYFCTEYYRGRTPNPCVFCNRYIKFGRLWDFAAEKKVDLFATGHYVKLIRNGPVAALYQAPDTSKDQSYALAMIDKRVLPNLIFSMSDFSKRKVIKLAHKIGLDACVTSDSQDICFVPDNNYAEILEHRCPNPPRAGNIVDSSGKVLGRHIGIHGYTIGQRRGLKVAMGKPYYVIGIDAAKNTVVLGPKNELMNRGLVADGVNWLADVDVADFRAKVRIRYNHEGSWATVSPGKDEINIFFDREVSAITPGQLAAFYVPDEMGMRLVGGAWIKKSYD